MYAGVPRADPLTVSVTRRPSTSLSFATPKSAIFTRPDPSRRMFSGLMSRCSTPCPCAYSKAAHTPGIICSASFGDNDPDCITCLRFTPSTYSISSQQYPRVSPISNTLTMFGCCSRASARPSLVNRSTNDGSFASSGIITFNAATRPNPGCITLYTRPIPPDPINSRI